MQLPGRSPANTAMTAMTLDALSGGRFILGLGTSGPQVVEGWHGVPFDKPLTWMREYITIVQTIFAREAPLEFAGTRYQIPYRGPGALGLGKPLKSILHGRKDIPILSGSMAPKGQALAAEIADGVLLTCMHPERFDVIEPNLEAGFAKRDPKRRRREDFEIAPTVAVIVGKRSGRLPRAAEGEPRPLHRRDGRDAKRTSTASTSAASALRRKRRRSRRCFWPASAKRPSRPSPTRWSTRSTSSAPRSGSATASRRGRLRR